MSDRTLELIDNALRDWDTSGDAMRWTPEPAPVTPRPIAADFGLVAARIDVEPMARALRQVAEVIVQFGPKLSRLRAQLLELESLEADLRRGRMHAIYRHRQLARRKRARR